ncbi:MAG: putative ABC transporter permease [Bacilli bacterium]|nr:putative ABC transporter permease [Bacilli bacterium]
MKEVFNKYINNEITYDKYQKIGIISLIIVISGLFGWIYEFIFYYFNGGMKEFYMQGGNFLPWINIYAIGACLILLLTYKLKKNPLLVFLISFFSTGILEYFSGLLIYKLLDGVRFWDYNVEILNFGNIDGFVCLRSVLFFGISGLFLMYAVVPFIIYLSKKINKKTFVTISILLLSIVLFDEIYNLVITKIFNLPSAIDIYKSMGLKYVN